MAGEAWRTVTPGRIDVTARLRGKRAPPISAGDDVGGWRAEGAEGAAPCERSRDRDARTSLPSPWTLPNPSSSDSARGQRRDGSFAHKCVRQLQSFAVGSERSLTVPSSSSRISRPSERAPRKALRAEGRAKRVRDARLTRGRASGASGSPAEPRAGRAARSRDRPNRESRPPVREAQRLARARGDVGGGGAPDGGGRSARRHVHGRRRASPAEGGRERTREGAPPFVAIVPVAPRRRSLARLVTRTHPPVPPTTRAGRTPRRDRRDRRR